MFLRSEGQSGPNSFVWRGGRQKRSSALSHAERSAANKRQVLMPGAILSQTPAWPARWYRPSPSDGAGFTPCPAVPSALDRAGCPTSGTGSGGYTQQRQILPGRKRGLRSRAATLAARTGCPGPAAGSHGEGTASAPGCGQDRSVLPFLPLLPRPRSHLSHCAVLKPREDFSSSLPPSAISLRPERQGLHGVTF